MRLTACISTDYFHFDVLYGKAIQLSIRRNLTITDHLSLGISLFMCSNIGEDVSTGVQGQR